MSTHEALLEELGEAEHERDQLIDEVARLHARIGELEAAIEEPQTQQGRGPTMSDPAIATLCATALFMLALWLTLR